MYAYISHPEDTERPYWIFMGKNKFENDLLIKLGYKEQNLYWFHADKYSSGHVYLKLYPDESGIADVPKLVIQDCLQLCKSESIQGNKLSECRVIYTPWTNLCKSGQMNPGEVSFKSTSRCGKLMCYQRDSSILSRLKKTRVEVGDLKKAEDSIVTHQNKSDDGYVFLENLLRTAKKSKDGNYLVTYVEQNRAALIETETLIKQRSKQAKKEQTKSKKQRLKEEEEAWLNDDLSDI
ncbi:hypothetical protein ACO0QE_001390 [Hanseniaspora vineae]